VAPLDDAIAKMLVELAPDGRLHVELRGELDIVSVAALQPQIAAALACDSTHVVLDAAGLTYVDSSGLAVLLRLASRHGSLEIRHASDAVRQIIGAAGLASWFGLAAEPRPVQRRRFPRELLSVRESRIFVLDVLRDVEAPVRELAAVLVAEVATNAVLHAASAFEVAVAVADDAVRVEVADDGGGTPRLLEPDRDSTKGRGLVIVDRLSRRWGVQSRGDESKIVWFELERPEGGKDIAELDTAPGP